MFTFLIILILVIACLLILAVLMQNSKKEGLGNVYFGGDAGGSQLMGVKKTSDLLEQITWGLVIAMFSFTLITSLFINKTDRSGTFSASPNIDRVKEYGALPTAEDSDPSTPGARSSSEDSAVKEMD